MSQEDCVVQLKMSMSAFPLIVPTDQGTVTSVNVRRLRFRQFKLDSIAGGNNVFFI